MLGLLYKIQHWPMSGFFLSLGMAVCAVVLIAVLASKAKHKELGSYFNGLLIRCVLIGGSAALLYATPSRKILEIQYPNDPERVDLLERMHEPGLSDSARAAIYKRLDQLDEERFRREYEK
jgi:hypothetical protein